MSRYFQQNIVKELGFSSEEKFSRTKVLIIGAGGLGTPVATYLAAAGVGRITIIDGDNIEVPNLHRQFHYDNSQIGQQKATILAKRLKLQNQDIKIDSLAFRLTEENAAAIISDSDIVCDCSDNADTRILADKFCAQLSKPLIFAAVREWEGYVTILNYKSKIRLADLFSLSVLQDASNCAIAGIINTTCGIAGSIQANEVIKIISGVDGLLDGEILCFNSTNSVYRKFAIQQSHY